MLDAGTLRGAAQGQDVVYANLAGDMARQARAITDAMHAVGLKRLIFVSSMGPGETYRSVLNPYRDSAAEIEKSDLDFHHSPPRMVYPRQQGQLPDHAEGQAFHRA